MLEVQAMAGKAAAQSRRVETGAAYASPGRRRRGAGAEPRPGRRAGTAVRRRGSGLATARRGAKSGGAGAEARLGWFRQIFSQLPSGVMYFDRDGRLQEANPAARAALGLRTVRQPSARQVFGRAEMEENDGRKLGRATVCLRQALAEGRSWQRKILAYTTPAGERRELGVTLSPLREGSRVGGLLCLLTDLTAIRRLEAELRRRQSLALLGEMAAGIAHEFKNSLATISGYAELVHHEMADAEGREHSQKILQQVQLLSGVTSEFLAFARPLAIEPERVGLGRMLAECIESTRMQRLAAAKFEATGEFPDVWGDELLLQRAFLNLLRNACEAIAETGREGRVRLWSAPAEAGRVNVYIEDSGGGIAPGLQEKVFVPFFTTKPAGLGLGLALAHKFISALDGSLSLARAEAGATTFMVNLRLAKAESAAAQSACRG